MQVQPKLVVPGVLMLPFAIGQAYVWDWGGGLTVVDSGIAGSEEAILAAVSGLGRRPEDVREIVLTHYHDDHRGGAAELSRRTGARVLAHRAEAPVIRGEQPQTPPTLTERERPIAEMVLARMAPPAAQARRNVLTFGVSLAIRAIRSSPPHRAVAARPWGAGPLVDAASVGGGAGPAGGGMGGGVPPGSGEVRRASSAEARRTRKKCVPTIAITEPASTTMTIQCMGERPRILRFRCGRGSSRSRF